MAINIFMITFRAKHEHRADSSELRGFPSKMSLSETEFVSLGQPPKVDRHFIVVATGLQEAIAAAMAKMGDDDLVTHELSSAAVVPMSAGAEIVVSV